MNKQADKFWTLADAMQRDIDHKRAPRQENTRKRVQEAMQQRRDADRLEQGQKALRVLADAHESGDWSALRAIYPRASELKSRTAVEALAFEGRTYLGQEADGRSRYTPSILERLAGGKVDRPQDRLRDLEATLVGCDIPGYFPTGREMADDAVRLLDVQPGDRVWEPSAGKGDLVEAVLRAEPTAIVQATEWNYTLRQILTAKGIHLLAESDCLQVTPESAGGCYDRIILNPPFENGQDMTHVQHCFGLLKDGGRLVAIVSEAVFFREQRQFGAFRLWMQQYLVNEPEPIVGAFKNGQRPTGVTVRILVLDKMAEAKFGCVQIPLTEPMP